MGTGVKENSPAAGSAWRMEIFADVVASMFLIVEPCGPMSLPTNFWSISSVAYRGVNADISSASLGLAIAAYISSMTWFLATDASSSASHRMSSGMPCGLQSN
jgi:hypothetical protein